jgi:hypothetical protein
VQDFLGDAIEIEDERWLAKIFRGEHFFDVIFASLHGGMPVSDQWFEHAPRVEVFGIPVPLIAPNELILVQLHEILAAIVLGAVVS